MGLDTILAIVGFAVVAGYVGLAWLRRGRDPGYLDDPSILLPAPPPAMTAATATIVAGGGGRLAFTAALLDLAIRDEIAFVVEGRDAGADRLGIAFEGGESADPQVLINRRRPIGEGETWLLAELKAARALEVAHEHGKTGGPPPPEAVQAGMQMLATMMRMGAATADDDDSAAARAEREHGLLASTVPDARVLEQAYEQRTGRAMPDASRQRLEQLTQTMAVFSDPAAIARDPDAVADFIAEQKGSPLTAEEREQVRSWAAEAAEAAKRPAAGDEASYLPAARARTLQAPFLFGTLLQTYATRHGWTAGLPLRARMHWYWVAIREAAVGIVVSVVGSAVDAQPLVWLGGGILAGALVTALAAPAMAALSPLGASMRAQLAAYRRTLAATFEQAGSLDEARTASRLEWLETPDQTLVWGVALGLRKEIEAMMERVGRDGTTRYAPSWYRPDTPPVAGDAQGPVRRPLDDPSAMFEGVEAIGSAPAS